MKLFWWLYPVFLWKTFDQVINNLPTTFIHLKYGFMITSWSWILEKCHFITLENGNNRCNFSCDDIIIKNSLSEKTLELTVDNNLAFSDRRCRSQTSADVFVFNGSCKVHKKCVDGWHLSDQFYLFYKHLHTSLQSFSCLFYSH